MPTVALSSPIALGFQRPFTLTPDEPVDQQADGSFASVTVDQGDSHIIIDPTSTATKITGFVQGDGSLGDKQATISVDGHVGPGEVPVTLTVTWSVHSPDATALAFAEGSPDVPIPTAKKG